jgi:hypothetical protein
MYPLFATYSSGNTHGRVTRSETWEWSARSRALSTAMTLGSPLPRMSARWPVERVARGAATSRWMFAPLRSSESSISCRQSYEEPDNLDIDPDFAPGVYQAGGAHVEAVSTAMRDAGYDVNAYELNCALDAALSRGRAAMMSSVEAMRGPISGPGSSIRDRKPELQLSVKWPYTGTRRLEGVDEKSSWKKLPASRPIRHVWEGYPVCVNGELQEWGIIGAGQAGRGP